MKFEVTDFHTHPFLCESERIGAYTKTVNMTPEDFLVHMNESGVGVFCGSVLGKRTKSFEDIRTLNRHALKIREKYGERYIPGIHVHPSFTEESMREIDFAAENGIMMIGETVPYHHNWENYSDKGFEEILEYANGKIPIVSVHTGSAEDVERLEKLISLFKDITFVSAHPGYGERLSKHIEILKKYDNAYLDISGGGIELYGALRNIVERTDSKRLLFGTDFPVTSVKTCIATVLSEKLPDSVTEDIFSLNAKRILNIKK